MIRPAINHSNINSLINKIFSVEKCKKFKPAEEVYNLVFEHYNLEKDKFIFCSSNCWDIHGASKFGYNTVWINRNKDSEDILPGKIDKIVNSFDELKFRDLENMDLKNKKIQDNLGKWVKTLTDNIGKLVKLEKFNVGQSNPTYILKYEKNLVLRTTPNGKLLRGAHRIDREFKVMSALKKIR